ncbi:MAG TPA: hypothetical protein VHG32_15140 [Thermoanaerobaculia bacterium]|jgi:tetratricopeptide (TPR) repeat protein|nr:hypothetical protein [Thermoanaerobaculia bacterium]
MQQPYRSLRLRSGSRETALLVAVAALVAVLTLPVVAAAAPEPSAVPGPQPLTAAERRGVELATLYVAGGAAAWWPELARGSWLRALGQEAAAAEIETRAGPPAGSHWTLQTAPADFAAHGAVFTVEFPSGADDTLLLTLVEQDGALKIDSVQVAAESGGAAAGRRAKARGATGAASGAGAGGAAGEGGRGGWSWPRLLLAVLLLAGGGGAIAAAWIWRARLRRSARPATPVRSRASYAAAPPEPAYGALALGAGGVVLLALAVVAGAGLFRGGAPAPGAGGDAAGAVAASGSAPAGGRAEHVQLRVLLPLRRALTVPSTPAGNAPAPVDAAQADSSLDALAAAAGNDAGAAEVALLWRAQHRIDRGDAAGAETMLRGLPPQRYPSQLAELLRARQALLRLQPVETGLAYERALAAGVAHEGVLIEAVQALYILGFEDTAKRYLHELAAIGGRNAETYYDLADLALIDDQNVEAHRDFRIAWRLQPIARAELLSQSLSAFMLQDRDLRHMMSLGTFAEPMGACEAISRRAISPPPGFRARLLGEELRLTAGTSEVRASGACDLAPAGTAQDGANVWQEEREAAALARIPELRRVAGAPGALAQPVLRRQIEEAAMALGERQRWTELIEITEGLAQPTAILPVRLTRLRAAALARNGRKAEARQLLVRLALGDKASKRADPGALYQLADLLEQSGEFDLAIKLVTKANSELPSPPGGERILQLTLEKRLASSMEQLKSPHFIVSYPLSRGPAFGKEAMRILEAERERLQKWIPLPASGAAPIEVRLLPFQDFELGFSQGGDVLGLYDGVVRVPLGSLRRYIPFAVALMTHELAHAMIAQRTGDRAPHWFHEGLAQHVEMQIEGRANPIADYRATDRLLAFPLIEPALQSFSSAVWVSAAYDEALWTMNYIEARYGVGGIHRLMDGFRAGQTTNQALGAAFGAPVARFDQDVWAWCTSQAPRAWRADVVRYDGGDKKPKEF